MTENGERKWVIGIMEDGMKSDYWKLLKTAIQEWIIEEDRCLDYCKRDGLDEVGKYNRAVDRLKYLQRFLKINETIIGHHKSWLEKIEDKFEDLAHIGESFVKEIKR